MAEIFGVMVKNIKCSEDHEGCAMYSADVWLNKKKLGRWSQSYMCGPDEFCFDKTILNEAVEKFKNSDLVKPMFKNITNASILIDAVIRMTEDERNFKNGIKNGFRTFIAQQHGYRKGFWTLTQDINAIKKNKEYRNISSHGEKVNIYTSIDDFYIS